MVLEHVNDNNMSSPNKPHQRTTGKPKTRSGHCHPRHSDDSCSVGIISEVSVLVLRVYKEVNHTSSASPHGRRKRHKQNHGGGFGQRKQRRVSARLGLPGVCLSPHLHMDYNVTFGDGNSSCIATKMLETTKTTAARCNPICPHRFDL